MRNRIGRESESNRATATRNLGLMVVASLAVLLVLRAGWLACATPPTDLRPVGHSTSYGEAILSSEGKGEGRRGKEETVGRLSAEDYAILSTICPTAMDSLPTELLPLQGKGRGIVTGTASTAKLAPPHRLTAVHSPAMPETKTRITARITGIRVASRPDWSRRPARLAQADGQPAESSSDDGWLVSPEVWFVPEDHAKQSAEKQVEQASEEPSADRQDVVPPTEPAEKSDPIAEPLAKPTQDEVPPAPNRPAHDWPVLPPKPIPSPEQAAGAQESAPLPQMPPVESARAESAPADLPTVEPAPSGPLLTEPDFVEPDSIVEKGEMALPEDTLETEQEATSPATHRNGPLFTAPSVRPAPVEPNDPQVQSLPTPKSTAESENLPPPEPPLPVAKEQPKEIVPAPIKKAPLQAPVQTPIQTIGPQQTQPALAPAPTSASVKLFAPPVPSSRTPISSVHGAGAAAAARKASGGKSADLSHAELFSKNCYPSAKDCAKCHEKIYDEWSLSSHAYAYVSPMFHRFEQTINDLSQGTVGTFCLRCHSPAGISMAPALGQTRTTPIAQTSAVSRDGVGCISCHRVNERFGKVNGERRVVTGDLFDPVYGGLGGDGVAAAIAEKTKYKLKTSAGEKGPGQSIHNEGRFFDQLTRAEACVSCHQVAVQPGIKLEVVWEQYRASPACEKGVTCQDCHMGRIPGIPSGYNYGPIAEVAGKTVRTDRKQSNHSFYGPGYSIAHPGIFPQHPKSDRWTIDEWMLFDWRAGWGTEDFEDRIADAEEAGQNIAAMFPPIWCEEDDRYDARDIIEDNLEKLKIKHRQRELVMENGSKVDGPFFRDSPVAGQDLKFEYIVTNLNEGHNLPTASLGAQPQLWANVVLIGPDGRRVWESGYTDSYGDVCDIHSEDVQKGRAPYDSQLFNLQTMFMITGATGTDREFYLPVNLSIDQVALLRPGTLPISVLNHPPFIRMENRSIGPLGKKRAKYRVPAEVMCQPGHYRLSFRMRSRVEPMYFMRFVGATEEMQRAMSEGILDVHPMSVEFEVKAPSQTARQPAMNEGWMR